MDGGSGRILQGLLLASWVAGALVFRFALGEPPLRALAHGVGAGTAATLLLSFLFAAVAVRFLRPLPPCRTGACRREEDYERLDGDGEGLSPGDLLYRCRCGTSWLHRGRVFHERAPSGELVPWKRRLGLWWVDP